MHGRMPLIHSTKENKNDLENIRDGGSRVGVANNADEESADPQLHLPADVALWSNKGLMQHKISGSHISSVTAYLFFAQFRSKLQAL